MTWGLRDYGLEPLVWGGDDHEHEWGEESYQRRSNDGGKTPKQASNAGANSRDEPVLHAFCACGAWRGSLGLEPTIDLYVQHIVEVFREVRRVMRPDATLWLNLGDSYAGSNRGGFADESTARASILRARESRNTLGQRYSSVYVGTAGGPGLKPKDLCMMPARVAMALQADGWWVRSRIIWSKPNPMPESVTDRPTTSHEYLFLLTKAERCFYDADAIREPQVSDHPSGNGYRRAERLTYTDRNGPRGQETPWYPSNSGRNKRSVWEIATEPMGYEWCRGCGMVYTTAEYRRLSAGAARRCTTDLDESGDDKCGGTEWEALESGRLVCLACEVEYAKSAVDKMPRAARCRRCGRDDAWGSHFATFPQKLVEPCILAGTSERGVCPECAAPWERVVERIDTGRTQKMADGWDTGSGVHGTIHRDGREAGEAGKIVLEPITTGWRPSCECGHGDTIPCIVLDPFAGSGTVAYVAQRLGRRSIGIDLSAEYLTLAAKRLEGLSLPMEI